MVQYSWVQVGCRHEGVQVLVFGFWALWRIGPHISTSIGYFLQTSWRRKRRTI